MTSLRSPPPPSPTPRSWTIGAGGMWGVCTAAGHLREGAWLGVRFSLPSLAEAPHSLPPDVRPLAWLRRRGRGGQWARAVGVAGGRGPAGGGAAGAVSVKAGAAAAAVEAAGRLCARAAAGSAVVAAQTAAAAARLEQPL